MSQQTLRNPAAASDSFRSSTRSSGDQTTSNAANTAAAGDNPAPQEGASRTDIVLRWAKEGVAALIGIALIVCLVLMINKAFEFIGRDPAKDPSFQHVKDLLLFINPLVGVVIGYYFNRVSTEARAESAERTAQGATNAAQQAQAARDEAQEQSQSDRADADESAAALRDIIPVAQSLLSQLPATASPSASAAALGEGGGAHASAALADSRAQLQRSLERARALTERRSRNL